MNSDLENRNTTGVLIAFVRFKEEEYYCMAAVEYWIVEWWNGYVDLSQGTLEESYFNYLRKFRLDYVELAREYRTLIPKNNPFEIEGNKPSIYIDFNHKYFKSHFFEQGLENRMSNGWTGEYGEIDDLIPPEAKYWET